MFASLADAKPPFWDDQVNNTGRFKVLSEFGGAAVFDKETGLVWEQSPSTISRTWLGAQHHCNTETVGNRKGWRLPTVQELTSLLDTSNSSPALPTGHPFTLTSSQEDGFYWSATTLASDAAFAWFVDLSDGDVDGSENPDNNKTGSSLFGWCVRGGQGVDPQ